MTLIRFFRAVPDTVPPMPADKSALSTLPLQAYQHCEAVRQASGLGWYIFPPRAAILRFDGRELLLVGEDGLRPCGAEFLGEDFTAHWQTIAPPSLAEQEIAWLEPFTVPGVFQIWSGLFVATAPGWQIWIKGLANVPGSGAMSAFEGLVRTDRFQPAPLFGNFQIHKTDRDVVIDPNYPLFQVIAVPAERAFQDQAADCADIETGDSFDWDGYARTTRDPDEDTTRGRYGAEIRRADRQ